MLGLRIGLGVNQVVPRPQSALAVSAQHIALFFFVPVYACRMIHWLASLVQQNSSHPSYKHSRLKMRNERQYVYIAGHNNAALICILG